MRTAILIVAAVLLGGCSSKPTAKEACARLESAGVAKNCAQKVPEVINARAKEEYVFDLPAPAGKTGHVLSFAKADDYTATVKAYEALAMLAGSHRYGSEKALIFVQLNSEAPLEVGAKAKEVVDAIASGGSVAPLVLASAAATAAPVQPAASASARPDVDPADAEPQRPEVPAGGAKKRRQPRHR